MAAGGFFHFFLAVEAVAEVAAAVGAEADSAAEAEVEGLADLGEARAEVAEPRGAGKMRAMPLARTKMQTRTKCWHEKKN
jgi:hypothetical protein